ncbi:hypothetical protein CTI12_AA352880 [Artemisia annua]|uniref:Uncharacterized protein n=1 Tax=Artemisia annua TaxID=35608 RepID=A0A2U1MQF7_ARTAN|nr:hypothetical protein CTI12_AA352880 [Artemisia annua]
MGFLLFESFTGQQEELSHQIKPSMVPDLRFNKAILSSLGNLIIRTKGISLIGGIITLIKLGPQLGTLIPHSYEKALILSHILRLQKSEDMTQLI